MLRKFTYFAFLAAGLTGVAPAQAALSCIEVGQVVEGVAQARDRQQTQSRVIEIFKEDGNFTATEKKTLAQYIHLVYQNPDMPPRALANAAVDTCYRPNTTARPRTGK
jgi:hypothetical protein